MVVLLWSIFHVLWLKIANYGNDRNTQRLKIEFWMNPLSVGCSEKASKRMTLCSQEEEKCRLSELHKQIPQGTRTCSRTWQKCSSGTQLRCVWTHLGEAVARSGDFIPCAEGKHGLKGLQAEWHS